MKVGTRITEGATEYLVTEELGEGGLGIVFKGQRTKPDALDVAIKVPDPDFLRDDPNAAARFAREARIQGNITHRNVAKLIRFWTFAGRHGALLRTVHPQGLQPRDAGAAQARNGEGARVPAAGCKLVAKLSRRSGISDDRCRRYRSYETVTAPIRTIIRTASWPRASSRKRDA